MGLLFFWLSVTGGFVTGCFVTKRFMGLPYRLPLQNPSADPYHISYHPTHCVRQLNTHSAILIILGVFATGSKRSTCVRWTRWRPLPPPRRPHSRSWGRTTLATRCFRSRCLNNNFYYHFYSRSDPKAFAFEFVPLLWIRKQCCGSESGSTCFGASWIRILLSPSKISKKNLDSYCFVTSFWLFVFKNDVTVLSKSN